MDKEMAYTVRLKSIEYFSSCTFPNYMNLTKFHFSSADMCWFTTIEVSG